MKGVCFYTIPDFATFSPLFEQAKSERCVEAIILRRCANYKVVGRSSLLPGSSWARISATNKILQMEKAHVRGVFHAGPGSACWTQGHSIGAVQRRQSAVRVLLLARRKEGDGQDACY
jgi:hypothetical protein